MPLTKFISFYFVFVGILIGIATFLPYLFPGVNLLVAKFWLLFGFMAGVTLIAYVLAYLGIKRTPEMGVMAIMASIAVKMIFCMAFVLIYSQKVKETGFVFALNFFSLYLLFTVFEIYGLLRNLRHQNLK